MQLLGWVLGEKNEEVFCPGLKSIAAVSLVS